MKGVSPQIHRERPYNDLLTKSKDAMKVNHTENENLYLHYIYHVQEVQ